MDGQLREAIRAKLIESSSAPVPASTRRDVRLPGIAGKAIAVIGMRRAGKTTFLWQLLSDRLARGATREGLVYFNFEDERLAGLEARDLGVIVEEYFHLYPERRDREKVVFYFDEIQRVPGWEAFARRLLDSETVELYLSGTSAKLLSREVATSMRSRAMEAVVYPFSFREALRHAGQEPRRNPARLPKAERSALGKALRDYLVAGGFPEAQGAAARDRLELLRGYVNLTLLLDVIERHGVTQPFVLRSLLQQLLANPAGTFSVNKFHNDLRSQGVAIAKGTLHDYLGHLEDAFLVGIVSLATQSARRRMVNPRKIYPMDPALVPIFDRSGRPQLGHLLETAVYLELARRGYEVTYVKTKDGFEVDFLARDGLGRSALIQVAASLDAAEVREREARALLAAAAEHPDSPQLLITLTPETARGLPPSIAVKEAALWLLADDLIPAAH